MEYFRNAKVIRLLSRHNKYLTADDNQEDGVRQHRSGASRGARWEVELVENKNDVIRLKSCFNSYLAASDKRFLLGATGRKVILLPLPPKSQPQSLGQFIEWKPVSDGARCVKLQTVAKTFLRANGFIKPYGNTVTHGNPQRTITQESVFWEVDLLEIVHNLTTDTPPPAIRDVVTPPSPFPQTLPPGRINDLRRASTGFSTDKELAALASVNSAHSRRSSSTMSEVSESSTVSQEEELGYKPSTRSLAVDSPRRPTRFRTSSTETTFVTATQQSLADSSSTASSTPGSTPVSSPSRKILTPASFPPQRGPTLSSSPPRRMPHIDSPALSRTESPRGGRLINYHIADDDGEVDPSFESGSFEFHGSTVQGLIHSLEEQTGLDGFILCKRNIINNRLCKLRLNLSLPPDREPMDVFIVHPLSKVAKQI